MVKRKKKVGVFIITNFNYYFFHLSLVFFWSNTLKYFPWLWKKILIIKYAKFHNVLPKIWKVSVLNLYGIHWESVEKGLSVVRKTLLWKYEDKLLSGKYNPLKIEIFNKDIFYFKIKILKKKKINQLDFDLYF